MPPQYRITTLESPENALLLPEAINDRGQIIAQMVVGGPFLEINDEGDISFTINDNAPAQDSNSETPLSTEIPRRSAVLIENDGKALINLGTFSPTCINNSGHIVGLSIATDFSANIATIIQGDLPLSVFQSVTSQVVFWDGSEVRRLFDDTVSSRGASINEKSEIAGWIDEPFGADFRNRDPKARKGFVWSDGTVKMIDPPKGYRLNKIEGINNNGTIVAEVISRRHRKGGYPTRACSWIGTDWHFLEFPLVYNAMSPIALNNNDQILVMLSNINLEETTFKMDWFLWDEGTLIPVDLCGQGLNDAGEVVGFTDGGSDSKATLWRNGHVADLNDLISPNSGWTLHRADAINNHGQIVGLGTFEGADQAFLLTPVSR